MAVYYFTDKVVTFFDDGLHHHVHLAAEFILGVIHSGYVDHCKCNECIWLVPGQPVEVLETDI